MKKLIAIIVIFGVAAILFFVSKQKVSEKEKDIPGNEKSIAVIPFLSLSNDTSQEYFCDGLSEGIINSLSHLQGLKVSARYSVFKFRNKSIDIKEVGKELGVQLLLEGSIQKQAGRVRVNSSLINVEDGFNLWSEQFDEDANDAFIIQDKISNAIAEKLQVTVLHNSQNESKKSPGIEAYELYLKGRSFWNKRTPPNLKKAIEYFNQAIATDSNYALAFSGIADCYTALGYGSFIAPAEAFPKALQAAVKALQLDSTLAAPHASIGYYRFYYDWDWAAAEQEFRKAIALNPNYELAYDWYGYYLTAMKRYDEAAAVLQKAAELDPLSAPIATDIGFSLYYSGNYDAAIKQLNTSIKMDQKLSLTHLWLGRSFEAQRKYPEAIAEYQDALAGNPNWPVALAAIGHVYGEAGEKLQAKKILDSMMSLSSHQFVTSYGIALVYAGLNDSHAFQWLENAYNERSNWLVWLKTDPRWGSFNQDKRFAELINKVGLPQ
ncbi:MAG: tetratricopeptide repeat protein [Bacteroidetes bacterium]|nr:tetratricopeptide repeat protein [Bacteroidota bacterium]